MDDRGRLDVPRRSKGREKGGRKAAESTPDPTNRDSHTEHEHSINKEDRPSGSVRSEAGAEIAIVATAGLDTAEAAVERHVGHHHVAAGGAGVLHVLGGAGGGRVGAEGGGGGHGDAVELFGLDGSAVRLGLVLRVHQGRIVHGVGVVAVAGSVLELVGLIVGHHRVVLALYLMRLDVSRAGC